MKIVSDNVITNNFYGWDIREMSKYFRYRMFKQP